MTDKVVYDTKAFEAAHRRFLTDPKTVTDDDLALFDVQRDACQRFDGAVVYGDVVEGQH